MKTNTGKQKMMREEQENFHWWNFHLVCQFLESEMSKHIFLAEIFLLNEMQHK